MRLDTLTVQDAPLILAGFLFLVSGTIGLYIYDAAQERSDADVFESIATPRLEGLKVGMSVGEVINHIGSQPSSIDATEYASTQQLTWTTLHGQRFVVRFVNGRLASQNLTT